MRVVASAAVTIAVSSTLASACKTDDIPGLNAVAPSGPHARATVDGHTVDWDYTSRALGLHNFKCSVAHYDGPGTDYYEIQGTDLDNHGNGFSLLAHGKPNGPLDIASFDVAVVSDGKTFEVARTEQEQAKASVRKDGNTFTLSGSAMMRTYPAGAKTIDDPFAIANDNASFELSVTCAEITDLKG